MEKIIDGDFQKMLKRELDIYLSEQKARFAENETLKMDLHCHDCNSDEPDELIGRILNVPETWTASEKVIDELKANACNAFTITNHNNARSCHELRDKGFDVLTGAEFSCFVPDFEVGIHVLAYGFSPEQETKLEKSRRNLYAFLECARKYDVPTVWAHPLYHYSTKSMPPQKFFNKMMLMFERFETMNGQRDTLQNMLVSEWVARTTPEDIDRFAAECGVAPDAFCSNPYRKTPTGGSDSHIGVFAGLAGSYLHVPNLRERLKSESPSALALEALRDCRVAPFGSHQNAEKLVAAFLDYVCQIALNYRDPGLMRLLLHKGGTTEKIVAVAASNVFGEVRRHKVTLSFIRMFHDCMTGKAPAQYKRLLLPREYRPIFDLAAGIASGRGKKAENRADDMYGAIVAINNELNALLASRLESRLKGLNAGGNRDGKSPDDLISRLELPTFIRSYIDGGERDSVNLSKFLDGLSFPFFTLLFLLGAHFAGAKVLFNTRPLLRRFAANVGKFAQPERVLWLTDTFADRNGVSMFLRELHGRIKERNLPIDILVCDNDAEPDDRLVVLKPVASFSLPQYPDQRFNVPNFVELHNLFLARGYDRIVCSTEGVMGLCALYLKHAYTVEATFFMHTDWLTFARKTLNVTGHNLSRVRRALRFFYRSFDRVLALNSEHRQWLTGGTMNLDPAKVFLTAHWANERFSPRTDRRRQCFGVGEDTPVVLYVGRVSPEKGVTEFPVIMERIRRSHPSATAAIVGSGKSVDALRAEMPDAVFIDWVEQERLPEIYSSADLLLLPSRFDTFCNAAVEALSCGLPVIAFDTKGPKDIVIDGVCGFLVKSGGDMAERAVEYLNSDGCVRESFRLAAVNRAADYNPDAIVNRLLESLGMSNNRS